MDIFNRINKWIGKIGTYRITDNTVLYDYPAFVVEVRGLFMWHTVKVFASDDTIYALNCAHELLDMLNEEID